MHKTIEHLKHVAEHVIAGHFHAPVNALHERQQSHPRDGHYHHKDQDKKSVSEPFVVGQKLSTVKNQVTLTHYVPSTDQQEDAHHRMMHGVLVSLAVNGRPIGVHRTKASLRKTLVEFIDQDSVGMGIKIRACPDRYRERLIEQMVNALVAYEKGPNDVIEALRFITHQERLPVRWTMDFDLYTDIARCLDKINGIERNILSRAIKQWVSEHNPKQLFKRGDRVRISEDYPLSEGIIAEIDKNFAQYGIAQIGCEYRRVAVNVNFEDVEAA